MSHTYLPFQRYDEEFKSLTKQVQQSLQADDDDEESAHTGALISQCDELLQQMALEARSVPDASLKRELLQQVRTCKSELQSFKEQSDKNSLMGSAKSANATNSHRQRLLNQQDQLEKQNSQLDNARKVMEETEQVALEIGQELGHNRETLESSRGRIQQVTTLTGRARRIVSAMSQRAIQQKIILYGVAGSVIVVFCILVWWLR
jgi:vesicle transport through interaction with t-SNAREs protein 1